MIILSLGHATYDITIPLDNYPKENEKYRQNEVVKGIGGSACIVAYLLGKWGQHPFFAGIVGNDDRGKMIKDVLNKAYVNTQYLETSYEDDTSLSFVIVNKSTGSRTMFSCAQHYPLMRKYQMDFKTDVIFVDGHDPRAAKFIIERNPQAISIIDADIISDGTIELCKKVKYLVCSANFAEKVTNKKFDYKDPQSLLTIYQILKNYFNNEIIVTLEEHGVLYAINNQVKLIPSLNVKVLDTTGAGDIFHGAFVYAIANKYDLDTAVKLANITGGLSAMKIGVQESVPSFEEVKNYYEQYGVKLNDQKN